MTYLLKYNKKKGLQGKFNFILAGLIFFFILFYFNIFGIFSGLAQWISFPIWHTGKYLSDTSSESLGLFQSKKTLIQKNLVLTEEVEKLKAQTFEMDLLWLENYELRDILKVNSYLPSLASTTVATILTKPNFSPYDSFIVSAGKKQSVKVGDKIFAYNNILLGEVVETYLQTSKVKLYSSYGEQLNVVVSLYNIATVAEGQGGGNLKIVLPRNIDIRIGDNISIPKMSLATIGIVEKIISNPADSFQTILFKTPINIYELKWVNIRH